MKRIILVLLLALSIPSATKADDVRVSFDFFYETLAPYGEWLSVEGYGYVWRPTNVAADWAPYTDGYWAYTDAGWTWVSYEDWGSITYHYGRWIVLRDFGWCWVPGYDWGPAWVSWRTSDEYIGWAPLPPEALWQVDTGFGTWVDAHYQIGPGAYRFCRVPDFGAPIIRNVLLPPPWNVSFIERTRNVTNITWRGDHGCVFNGGLDFAWVTPFLTRPLPALRLVRSTQNVIAPGRNGNVLMSARIGQTLHFGAPPRLAAGVSGTPPPRVSRNVAAPIIDRGWAGPANDPARERLAAKFRQEIQGATPQTAPARPFHPNLVTMVPTAATLAARPAGPPTSASPATIGRSSLPPPPSVPPPAAIPQLPIQEPARRTVGNRPNPPHLPPPGIAVPSAPHNLDLHRAAEMNAMRLRNETPPRPIEIQRQQRPAVAPPAAPRQQAPPPTAAPSRPPPPPPGSPGTSPPPPQAGRPPPPPNPGFPPPPSDLRRRGP